MSEHTPQEQLRQPELDEAGSRSTPPGNAEAFLVQEKYVAGAAVVSGDAAGHEQQLAEAIPHGHSRIEQDYGQARAEFERDFLVSQAGATDTWGRERTFAQAEPNYRAGFIAGNDLRYHDQTFEEIEADLHREYISSIAASTEATLHEPGGDHWTQLREEIRAGFLKARTRG